jgi:type III restriction enzyme
LSWRGEIRAEMLAHFWEEATGYEVQVSRGFTELKPCNYTADGRADGAPRTATRSPSRAIKQMLFGGFTRCLYPLQKFDSDTERRFAVILERDALKWFKPAKGQFQIYYKLGSEQPEYIPDFVAETDSMILMVETKARIDIDTPGSAGQGCRRRTLVPACLGARGDRSAANRGATCWCRTTRSMSRHFEVKPHSCG